MEPVTHRPTSRGVERWCQEFIESRDAYVKLEPPAAPDASDPSAWTEPFDARPEVRPGRPAEWRVEPRSPKTPKPGALVRREIRAQLMHTFCHHELQAAELFAWGILAFPETPRDFRVGLLMLCRQELEHLRLYRRHLEALGSRFGAYPVRDWFWDRVVQCRTPAAFVGLLGLGLEGANLEHAARFADAFRNAGDDDGARILDRVEREETAHVAFALKWFEYFTGAPLDYDGWRAVLPPPLTPALFRGSPLNRTARRRAGMDEAFLARLEAERPAHLVETGEDELDWRA